MQETERVKPGDDFRQGDILRLEDGPDRLRLSELGIIINADCDLVHGKLDGVIAYLPVYPFHTYLARFWAPSYVDELRRTHLERVKAICNLDDREADELLHWLPKTPLQEIHARLSTSFNLKNKNATDLHDKLEKLAFCTDPDRDPLAVFSWFCHRDKNAEQFARKQIAQAYAGMGDGHFFISEIVGNAGIGFVIRMRRIYTIDADCCFPSQSSRLASTAGDRLTAFRVARLAPPFRFKLAQLFAYQFSRIGLPDEVTALSGLAIEDALHQLLENSV